MKIVKITIVVFGFAFLSGCASMFVPGSEEINKLQIVKMGSKKPEGNEYILHIPAGAEIPVRLSIKGSYISKSVDSQHVTTLNQDLYVYKYWASLDGKNWQPTRDLVHMPIAIGVDSESAQVKIKVDAKVN